MHKNVLSDPRSKYAIKVEKGEETFTAIIEGWTEEANTPGVYMPIFLSDAGMVSLSWYFQMFGNAMVTIVSTESLTVADAVKLSKRQVGPIALATVIESPDGTFIPDISPHIQ